ncbi:MAG: glycosyltransferase, partial [Pirellulaceae bacterium]|nr:glycosyltransferase [Pirellulaceae bacterium]
SNWRIGKPQCKEDLQHIMGLPVKSDAPLIGIIGRLAEQKGWDLIIELMRCWLPDSEVQWAILGTGEARFEKEISELVQRFPERISAQLTFSNELAHKIEAGADMFLMPSRYEPCGLNQLYSLKYGTVPIVRATGGLQDSVTNADQKGVTAGEANGFSFSEYSAAGIQDAVHRAVLTYSEHQEIWGRIVETGMKQDWSWTNSARHYVDLYQSTLSQLSQKSVDCPIP